MTQTTQSGFFIDDCEPDFLKIKTGQKMQFRASISSHYAYVMWRQFFLLFYLGVLSLPPLSRCRLLFPCFTKRTDRKRYYFRRRQWQDLWVICIREPENCFMSIHGSLWCTICTNTNVTLKAVRHLSNEKKERVRFRSFRIRIVRWIWTRFYW